MKKIIAMLLALVMVFALCACGQKKEEAPVAGLICLHDENSGYDANFINGFNAACEALGVKGVIKTNIDDTNSEGKDAACELADAGCKVVFSDSYGHGSYLLEAAREYPNVQFTSCTADNALTAGVDNFHNAFASIYEGRYLAGIAAGKVLLQKYNGQLPEGCKVGYVAAMPYAEVMSGYTSWFLGLRSVEGCENVTMDVVYTGTWLDETLEKEAAEKLIAGGCVLISQHADSMGAPNACELAGVPNVSYNGSTYNACKTTYIVSSRIDWQPYFEYAIKAVLDGKNYDTDWCGTLKDGSVKLTELNPDTSLVPADTQEAIDKAKAALLDGSLHVFDVSTFQFNGENPTSMISDVIPDAAFTPETEAVADGYFHESEFRSAPYFYGVIDGINILS